MPAAFFAVALTPVYVLGCRTRGLLALLVAFVSGLAALVTIIRSRREQRRGGAIRIWRLVTAVILTIPVIALIIMA